jgi:hypothetical protein
MKRIGNVTSNRIYNPQNARAPVPFDADEADSAMERFIRQKYQDRTAKAQTRQDTGSTNSDDQPPPLPPKPGSRFGFRSASSIFPLSSKARREAAARPDSRDRSQSPPRRNKPSRLFGADVGSPTAGDLDIKLAQLRDMGFRDEKRNLTILKGHGGNVEKSIETLVRLGEGQAPTPALKSAGNSGPSSRSRTPITPSAGITINRTQEKSSPNPSNNPFDMLDAPAKPAQPQSSQSTGGMVSSQNMANNPYQQSQSQNPYGLVPSQSQYSLNQAFQNMSVTGSQPLFPNHTGGFPGPQQQLHQLHLQSMTPPVPSIPQQYYPPVIYENSAQQPQQNYNPFMQQQVRQPPSLNTNIHSNPYAPHSAPVNGNFQSNPYGQQQQNSQATPVNTNFQSNPFGQPQQIQQAQPAQTNYQSNPYGQQQQSQQAPAAQTVYQSNPYSQPQQTPQGTPLNTDFQSDPYAQQQQAPQNLVQSPVDQSSFYDHGGQQQQNPFFRNNSQQDQQAPQQSSQYQAQEQNPYQQFRGQTHPPLPQQTGRADKRSILDLYNFPQLAPTSFQSQLVQNQSQQSAPAPDTQQQQRSVSSPLTGAAGSKNPFMTGGGSAVQSPSGDLLGDIGQYNQQGQRQISRESVIVNTGDWQNGRHSPDAWGTISARSMR